MKYLYFSVIRNISFLTSRNRCQIDICRKIYICRWVNCFLLLTFWNFLGRFCKIPQTLVTGISDVVYKVSSGKRAACGAFSTGIAAAVVVSLHETKSYLLKRLRAAPDATGGLEYGGQSVFQRLRRRLSLSVRKKAFNPSQVLRPPQCRFETHREVRVFSLF